MTVVGTAEIVIIPSVRKFGDIGAKIQSQLSGVGMAATGVAGKFGTAEKAAAGVRGEVEAAGLAAASAGGRLGVAGENAGKFEGGLGRVRGAAGSASAGLRAAESNVKGFGERLGAVGTASAGTFGGMTGSVRAFAAEAAKLTGIVGVAGLGYALVKGAGEANKFEAEITKLNTQAGVSKDKLAGLSSGVLDLAGKVGANPDSLAESLFHVESNFSSMGISSSKALSLVETAAKGARVGNANLVDVTNALTAAVAANIPGVENLDEAMGYL